MSTRAERRLKEATDAHQKAVEAHQEAVAAFTTLEAAADRGEVVDPLDYATAEGAVKIKAKHLDRAHSAMETERFTVDEERSRATRRDIAQAAEALAVSEIQAPDLVDTVQNYARQIRTQSAAWQKVYDRVRDEIGLFPWEGETRATADKVSGVPDIVHWHNTPTGRTFQWSGRPMTDRFWLDGVVYVQPSPYTLEERLVNEVKAAFRRSELEAIQPAAA